MVQLYFMYIEGKVKELRHTKKINYYCPKYARQLLLLLKPLIPKQQLCGSLDNDLPCCLGAVKLVSELGSHSLAMIPEPYCAHPAS